MNALDYIVKKYQLDQNQPSPLITWRSRDWEIPRLFKELGFNLGAEIGVAEGLFSELLCKKNPNLKLYLVDAWQQYAGYTDESTEIQIKNYREVRERMKPYNAQIIEDWSMNAVKRFADESLDFVFIDANHTYQGCSEDIREWSRKVKKGGIVCGHDYKDIPNFSVIRAVDEWVKKNDIKPLFILKKDTHPTWMYVK